MLTNIYFLYSRDLGEYLREQGKIWFAANNTVTLKDEIKVSSQIESLERIVSNEHSKNNPRILTSTATGLTPEQCSQILSTEFLEYICEESKNKK